MCAKKNVKKTPTQQTYTQLTKSYYSDLTAPNMLFAKIIRSNVSKGKIKSITAGDLPEGYYFFTAKDFGENNFVETLDIQTEIFASENVFYKGQPVGIIAGANEFELETLCSQIKIEIEKENIQKNKEKDFPYAQRFKRTGKAQNPEEFQKLFSKKNFDVKGTWTSVLNAPSCNEPNGALCFFEKNVLTICTPTQWPKHLQSNLRRVFNLKPEEIMIKKTISSSPYTNTLWINTILAIQTALVTIKTGKPVMLILSRHEHVEFMTKKNPITIKMRTSVRKDGLIEANQVLIELDSGYHNPFAAEILDRLMIAANNVYCLRNLEIVAKAYESFTPPSSFNIESIDTSAFFAIENQIQKICRTHGFLPDEFRIKNIERKIAMPFSIYTERIPELFSALSRQSDLDRKFVSYNLEKTSPKISSVKPSNIPLKGIGIASGFNGIGYLGTNIFACNQKMETTLESDGTFTIHAYQPSNSTLEIWKSTVSRILEIETKQIKLNTDFDITEESAVPETVFSNITMMTHLLKKCCLDIQSKRFKKPLPLSSTKGITVAQKKAWNKDKFSGIPFFSSSFGSVVMEVEVDPCTFKVKIKQIQVIINAGKIILPKIAETSVRLAVEHTLSELVQDEVLECSKITVLFMNSENESTQIDGIIPKILPAAFASALSQAIDHEINTLPVKTEQIFTELYKEVKSNENSISAK